MDRRWHSTTAQHPVPQAKPPGQQEPGYRQSCQAAQVLKAKAPGYKGRGQAWGQHEVGSVARRPRCPPGKVLGDVGGAGVLK